MDEPFESTAIFQEAKEKFPLLDKVGEHLRETGSLRGIRLAWHCHLTALTAVAARALADAKCRVSFSECNPATSDQKAIEYLQSLDMEVFTGPDSTCEALKHGTDVVSDTGFELISRFISGSETRFLAGACEITSSGITRLRALERIDIPVINVNDGRIKSAIENFHGVGDGVVQALKLLDQRSFDAGESASVVGYGRVGAGVAEYLRRHGFEVTVIETDPVRQLVAAFDGFHVQELKKALSNSSLLVTATGRKSLLQPDDWLSMKDDILVLNVGHWREELNLDQLRSMSDSSRSVNEYVEEFKLGARKICVATEGDPVNVALLTGAIEPTLLHLATELLSIAYLVENKGKLKAGEHLVPAEVESLAASLALCVWKK